MKWHWILDEQPEEGRTIIMVHKPYPCEFSGTFGKHYTMGMKKAWDHTGYDGYIEELKAGNYPLPDFWWIYAEEFPFPDVDLSRSSL